MCGIFCIPSVREEGESYTISMIGRVYGSAVPVVHGNLLVLHSTIYSVFWMLVQLF